MNWYGLRETTVDKTSGKKVSWDTFYSTLEHGRAIQQYSASAARAFNDRVAANPLLQFSFTTELFVWSGGAWSPSGTMESFPR
jgi:hypothetical protein